MNKNKPSSSRDRKFAFNGPRRYHVTLVCQACDRRFEVITVGGALLAGSYAT